MTLLLRNLVLLTSPQHCPHQLGLCPPAFPLPSCSSWYIHNPLHLWTPVRSSLDHHSPELELSLHPLIARHTASVFGVFCSGLSVTHYNNSFVRCKWFWGLSDSSSTQFPSVTLTSFLIIYSLGWPYLYSLQSPVIEAFLRVLILSSHSPKDCFFQAQFFWYVYSKPFISFLDSSSIVLQSFDCV